MGYSGIYLFHIEDLETNQATSHWVSSSDVYDIFKRYPLYLDKFQSAWKLHPTKRSRITRTIELESDPNGELDWLIDKLLERISNGPERTGSKATSTGTTKRSKIVDEKKLPKD
jgi:hypothetical protein